VVERDNTNQKWGIVIQGGRDMALTSKIASVKRFSPCDRAGLEKMDYVWTINGKEVFNMTQPQITQEVQNSGKTLELEIERGNFIVPSFDEIWPELGKPREGAKKEKRMGYDYIMEAMQHHGLGHLPQPDNFTTVGRLGIEVNQYNNPIECYSDDTIEDMREEKVIMDFPEAAEKILAANKERHVQMQDKAAQNSRMKKFDPARSSVLLTLQVGDMENKELQDKVKSLEGSSSNNVAIKEPENSSHLQSEATESLSPEKASSPQKVGQKATEESEAEFNNSENKAASPQKEVELKENLESESDKPAESEILEKEDSSEKEKEEANEEAVDSTEDEPLISAESASIEPKE